VTLLDTWPHLTSSAVKVEGFKDDINEETVSLFFESKKRSGGGTIEEVVIDQQQKSVVIVFESREGWFSSCDFCHRSLLKSQTLSHLDAILQLRSVRNSLNLLSVLVLLLFPVSHPLFFSFPSLHINVNAIV